MVAPEHHDGRDLARFGAGGVRLRFTNAKKDLLLSPDLTLRVTITASRVVLASSDHMLAA